QEAGVEERWEDGARAQAVGEALGGPAPREQSRAPGDGEAEHVAQVMAGIREQRHGTGPEAVGGLDGDEGEVEGDADDEGTARALRRGVGMPVIVMACLIVVRMHGRCALPYSRTAFDAA